MAVAVPFEPYDWLQRSVTAAVSSKEYRGDAIIVAIDDETMRELPANKWTKDDLAVLLSNLGKASPKQVVVDLQYFANNNSESSSQLADALASLSMPVVWRIDLAPDSVSALSRSGGVPDTTDFANFSSKLEPEIAKSVTPAVMAFQQHLFGAPVFAPVAVHTDEGAFPSLAVMLAGGVHGVQRNAFNVDLRYDPATVPQLRAGDVLQGRFDPSFVNDKRVIVSFTNNPNRDTLATPHDAYASRAAATVLAAQTLRDGPPVSIGWLPSFLAAILAALLWLFVRRPYGRIFALVTVIVIGLSPLVLEPQLVFQQTSQAVFLLLLLAVAKLWKRGRDAVRTYRNAAETKSRFLAQASHDLRQPIHAIGLLAERLSQTELSRDQVAMVSKISWSVDNASRMFRALLDIAAIESGTLKPDIVAVAINDLLADIDSQNALTAEQAKVDLRLVPSELIVKTDRALVGTILQNLVSNAIKYSPGKKVVVGCRRRSGKVSLMVVDNGRGISANELKHVRKEFYRSPGKSNLNSDNKGLGLAIVNRLAAMLGLKFVLRSKEGCGTSATIDGLTIVRDSNMGRSSQADRRLPLAGLRIVLAEDDEETRTSTERLLVQWMCEVDPYRSLPNKLPTCDIMLSDYDFGNGETLTDRRDLITQLDKSGAKLIIISGHHPEQIRSSLPEHRGLILSKPLRAAELRSVLMSARETMSATD